MLLTKIRLFSWALLAALLSMAVALIAPQQIPVALYKINLVAIAGVLGYWLDRSLFPYARPAEFVGSPSTDVFSACMIRRALIVAAAMLAVGLGA